MTREEVIKGSKNLREKIRQLPYIPKPGATPQDILLRGCVNVAMSVDFSKYVVVCKTLEDQQRIERIIGTSFGGLPVSYIVPTPSTQNS